LLKSFNPFVVSLSNHEYILRQAQGERETSELDGGMTKIFYSVCGERLCPIGHIFRQVSS